MKKRARSLGFLLGAVIAVFMCVQSAAAEGYVYSREFRAVNSLSVNALVSANQVDTEAEELEQYLEDALYAALRGRLPSTIKIYKPGQWEALDAQGLTWLWVTLGKPSSGGYYGNIQLRFQRKAYVTPAEVGDEPLFVTVYQNGFILIGGDVTKLKSELREATEEMALEFVTDFYAARPDLQ